MVSDGRVLCPEYESRNHVIATPHEQDLHEWVLSHFGTMASNIDGFKADYRNLLNGTDDTGLTTCLALLLRHEDGDAIVGEMEEAAPSEDPEARSDGHSASSHNKGEELRARLSSVEVCWRRREPRERCTGGLWIVSYDFT